MGLLKSVDDEQFVADDEIVVFSGLAACVAIVDFRAESVGAVWDGAWNRPTAAWPVNVVCDVGRHGWASGADGPMQTGAIVVAGEPPLDVH